MMKKITILMALLALVCLPAIAIPAHKGQVKVAQPDGTLLSLCLVGDEYYHFNTTADGYTVMLTEAGAYVYAERSGSRLVASSVVAHDAGERDASEQAFVATLTRRMTDGEQVARAQVQRVKRDVSTSDFDPAKLRGLVILINFSDVSFTMDDPQDFYNHQFNDEGYTGYDDDNGNHVTCMGSVRDYFSDQSNGAFQPQFDVYGPVTSSYKATQGNSRAQAIFIAAVKALKSQIDYSKYDSNDDGKIDMIYFIVAGYASSFGGNNSSYLWPHASSLWGAGTYNGVTPDRYASSTELYGWEESPSSVTVEGIGTVCHEFSHVLGLPDLYDTDYEENGQSHHPDEWDVMSGGSDFNYGRSPVGYSLYERYALGWVHPTVINKAGTYTLNALNTAYEGYRINSPVNKEFFLIENRQKTGWDQYLPGHGMLVVRVDSTNANIWSNNKVNYNPDHMYYELLRAGNTTSGSLASDPFPGTSGNLMITNTTSPNLKTWNGNENDLNVVGIGENDGVITFTVVADGEIQSIVEDFELMTANSSTSDKDVQGNFATWSFTKSGVRAPGEEKANGTNSVLMKLPSQFYSTSPVYYNFYQASAMVFNSSVYTAKYSLEYSTDGGTTWTKVTAASGSDAAEVAAQSNATIYWPLDLTNTDASLFRVAMVGGNKSASTYVDDFTLYYTGEAGGGDGGLTGDVNGDGEVTIADVNAIIDLILSGGYTTAADVNSDGEVTIADVNAVVDIILANS